MDDASTASMPLCPDGEQVARIGEPGGARRERAAGERLGAYELIRTLGRGGMAEVWLARRADGAFEREVALKIPLVGHMAAGTIERFSRECRILATLETPGIARLYDAGVDTDVPYIAMEYVAGEHINKWCDSHGLATAARIALFLQVLDAVGKAHAQNVIHRDLKPSNILVNAQGEVRLLDFGVARLLMTETDGNSLTRAYGRALTPEYASQEMLRGDPIDARSDIYSAGVVLFQLLTGTRPGTPTTASTQVLASLPAGLREVLGKALAAAPEDRYPDAASFAAALRPYSSPPQRRHGWWIAAAALAVLGAGIWLFQGQSTRIATSTAAVAQPALAVLPFADLSQARDQEYLADGLAEEILNQLAQVESLRLVSRTSSFSFKGKGEDSRAIGRQLGVTHLLEGSVRKDGDQLRITTQLIRTDDGTHMWSKTYAREFKDVLAVQDEISRDVATALSVKLDVGDLTRVAGGTTNVQAYEKFLQARAELAKEGSGWVAAQRLFREALEFDPGFGAAQLGLVRTLDGLVRSTSPDDPAAREMREIMARSAEAAPGAPWVLNLQANDQLAHHRWSEVDAAVQAIFKTPYGSRRAIDPFGTYPAIYLKWLWLFNVGRVAESLRINEEWAQDDPLGVWASTNLLYQLPYVGRDAEMPAEYARNSRLAGGNTSYYTEWSMLFHLLRSADAGPQAVKAQLDRLIGSSRNRPDPLDVKVLENLGNPQGLRSVLRAELQAPRHNHSLGYIAAYADAFGERDLALAAIHREAVDPVAYTPFRLPWVLWYPYKTGLRTDPRFKDIVREIGLVDYWRKTGNWGDFCKPVGADDFECR